MQDGDQQSLQAREKYQTLQRVYEARLDHLTASVRQVYQSIKSDEIGLTMQNIGQGMEPYFKARMAEVVEVGLSDEREAFLNRLAADMATLQHELGESNRKVHDLDQSLSAAKRGELHASRSLEELRRQAEALEQKSAAALNAATFKVHGATAEIERLKRELASSLDELNAAAQGFHSLKERTVTLNVQLASANSSGQALLQQLGATEAQALRTQQALNDEQQRSASGSTELLVLRERHVRTEERNEELKAQLNRVQAQLSELETEYGYADADLSLMCGQFGELNAHVSQVMTAEARSNEESLSLMQRRVGALKHKLGERVGEQRRHAASQQTQVDELGAEVASLTARCEELSAAVEREGGARLSAERTAEELSGSCKRWEAECRDAQVQSTDQASQLVRLRAEVEARDAHEAAAAGMVDDQLRSLRRQGSEAASRVAAAEQQASSERAGVARLEAAGERLKAKAAAAEAKASASEEKVAASREETQVLRKHLSEATAAISKLKGLIRQERSARQSSEQGAVKQAAENAEALAVERSAVRAEATTLGEAARVAQAGAAEATSRCESMAKQLEEKKAEAASLSAELGLLLKQLDTERKGSKERSEREGALAAQVDAFSAQFLQLEAALQRTHQEKASFGEAQRQAAEAHAREVAALEKSNLQLKAKLQALTVAVCAREDELKALATAHGEVQEALACEKREGSSSRRHEKAKQTQAAGAHLRKSMQSAHGGAVRNLKASCASLRDVIRESQVLVANDMLAAVSALEERRRMVGEQELGEETQAAQVVDAEDDASVVAQLESQVHSLSCSLEETQLELEEERAERSSVEEDHAAAMDGVRARAEEEVQRARAELAMLSQVENIEGVHEVRASLELKHTEER